MATILKHKLEVLEQATEEQQPEEGSIGCERVSVRVVYWLVLVEKALISQRNRLS